MLLDKLLDPAILGILIPIIAILGAVSVLITQRVIRHRERMAMIERGMHPDLPPPEEGRDGEEEGRVELELPERDPVRDPRR
jgi:hypothetical protein